MATSPFNARRRGVLAPEFHWKHPQPARRTLVEPDVKPTLKRERLFSILGFTRKPPWTLVGLKEPIPTASVIATDRG